MVRTFYKGEHPEEDGVKIITIGKHKYTRRFEVIDENKLAENVQIIRLKHIKKELEKNSNVLQLKFKADSVDLNDCVGYTAVINKDGYSYSLVINGAVVVDKAYLYKDGTAITKAEIIDLIDIKFKRALKKNDEYICKSK